MATNVDLDQTPDATAEKCSSFELLDWLNKTLDIKFTRVENICSGTVSIGHTASLLCYNKNHRAVYNAFII